MMGQIEVYEYLKSQRERGNHKFLSVTDIQKGLKERSYSNGIIKNVSINLIKLEHYNYVEFRMSGNLRDWKRLYRLRIDYCNVRGKNGRLQQ